MKKLLKKYGLNSDMQYFEMCIDSYINGQKKQAENQFIALDKKNRSLFLNALIRGNWSVRNEHILLFFTSCQQTHGGARPNSGRKPATEKRINHTVRLNPTEAELVKNKYGSLANLVRTAIG